MNKLIATFFLMSFAVVQYGKLVSYWNCKITKSSDPQVVKCDCEKILDTSTSLGDLNLQAEGPISLKAEECVLRHSVLQLQREKSEISSPTVARLSFSPFTGHAGLVFQPPKF